MGPAHTVHQARHGQHKWEIFHFLYGDAPTLEEVKKMHGRVGHCRMDDDRYHDKNGVLRDGTRSAEIILYAKDYKGKFYIDFEFAYGSIYTEEARRRQIPRSLKRSEKNIDEGLVLPAEGKYGSYVGTNYFYGKTYPIYRREALYRINHGMIFMNIDDWAACNIPI